MKCPLQLFVITISSVPLLAAPKLGKTISGETKPDFGSQDFGTPDYVVVDIAVVELYLHYVIKLSDSGFEFEEFSRSLIAWMAIYI